MSVQSFCSSVDVVLYNQVSSTPLSERAGGVSVSRPERREGGSAIFCPRSHNLMQENWGENVFFLLNIDMGVVSSL